MRPVRGALAQSCVFAFLSIASTAAAVACGGVSVSAPSAGGLREACYGNGTCNAGLTCASEICVTLGDGGSVVGAGSSSGGSDASTSATTDAEGPAEDSLAADTAQRDICSGAMTVAPGQTIKGTTCGGAMGVSAPCEDNPVVFFLVDAPDGAAVDLTLSAGARFLMYPTCQSALPGACSDVQNAMVETGPDYQVYGVNRYDTSCGDFTLSAALAE